MARVLCDSLRRSTLSSSALKSTPSILLSRGNRSAHSGKVPDDDVGSESTSNSNESSTSPDGGLDLDAERSMMKKMEEAMQALLVKKSTPDWIPFLPGSSFWVPPRRRPRRGRGRHRRPGVNVDVVELIDRLDMPEETLSLFTVSRGWPCLEFYAEQVQKVDEQEQTFMNISISTTKWTNSIADRASSESVEVDVEIVVIDHSEGISPSKDDEG